MSCDEIELKLLEGEPDAAAAAHLEGCARCAAFARESAAVLALAAQPPPTAAERTKLVSLPVITQVAWARLERRRGAVRKVLGLGVAACLGAVLAAGLTWRPAPPAPAPPEELAVWQVEGVPDDEGVAAVDDESGLEVSWPSLNEEGDVL